MKKRKAEFTLAWLMARCEEIGDCLIWKGYISPFGQPIGRIPGQKRASNIRRAVIEQRDGEEINRKSWAYATCEVDGCVHPDHLDSRTRSKATRGKPKSADHIAAITTARRKQSDYTETAIQEILDAPRGAITEVAARHGMSRQSACNLRAGRWRATQAVGIFSGLIA